MGFLDNIKNILTIPEEEEFEEEFEEAVEAKEKRKPIAEPQKTVSQPRIIGSKPKTVSFNPAQMQVVLVKPERYEDVTSIADHLNDKKTVVLNLESADR